MGGCLNVIGEHKSIRRYKPDPVPEEDLEKILEAARRHPSSWNLQPVTVFVVKEQEVKERLASILWNQPHIREAPVFLIFAVDYLKVVRATELLGVEPVEPGQGNLLSGVMAASMSLAWAALAAESLGYGVAFIAVYGRPCRVAEALKLPRYLLPIAGLLIGKPAESPGLRPRQPVEALVSSTDYGDPDARAKSYMSNDPELAKTLKMVMSKNGFYGEVNKEVAECLRRQGFRV
ncbi:MAG: nitroreductase family protein [Desulfurococcales archaeon]|nr:nitroreductase family protein [Desulfurococcales archaeon]